MNAYRIIIEKDKSDPAGGCSAYVPDLPGLGVAAGNARTARRLAQEAITLHVKMLRELGQPVLPPAPSGRASSRTRRRK